MLFQGYIPDLPFKRWIWQDKENRLVLCISVTIIILQFAVFKVLYPFPNFMPPDSNSYIEAAYSNQLINIWAIGYSKFLRLFSSFTNSHFALVLFQYILLQTCVLYFLYTIKYLLYPGKWFFRLAVAGTILNPLLLHISNFISSDAIFTALSLLWFTQLLWILYKPHQRLLLFHALVLLLAFTVRYNAVFYPMISVVVIFFTDLRKRVKVIGIGSIVFLLGAFTGRTEYQYYVETGTFQYSAFGGWLIGSNALYGYAYAKPLPTDEVPEKYRQLHAIVNRHMDSIRYLPERPDAEVAIYYFWNFKSPLLEYMYQKWNSDTTTGYFKRWATMAPLYAGYGRYLVQHYPILYLKYYVWPNFVKYYAPPAKFMASYNLGGQTVAPITVTWFGLKNNKISTYFKDKTIKISDYFTALTAFTNIFFALGFISFIYLTGFNRSVPYAKHILWWMFTVWIGNMVFSVLSAPIELRYQIFPMIITLVFGVLLTNFMVREIRSVSNENLASSPAYLK
ncbi:hypothetical protein SAMN04488505_102725 [Chitinophaga rupis]|uniref:Dolichyl-phosphate-mannose-protein mannosyltransferase n=1 Tax=Chitinophaga rupis TaxID=573321 RepID=A0A1H7RTQ8_9BACT|nr:hypothetical protein [Chitinophaga rupis]SEL63399.1 hypothetical protein SAMN04488505_102725 [Chitinophaga rupis]